jgi:alpha-N-arabinofuranosidase
MKIDRRKFIAGSAAGAGLILGGRAGAALGDYSATVKISGDVLHPLPRTIYSHFVEHLGKCVKGGIWAEGERPDLVLGGIRPELIAAVKSINPSLIRYPGGCFADGYHWKDGIGPKESRPRRPNRAWGKLGPGLGPEEDNRFGTDEFMAFCAAVGAEPMITANVGSGTPEEAADWVEYCNGPETSKWGAERAKNGHPAPYNVRHWFVGNEITGWHEIGWLTPAAYAQVFLKFAAAMRQADPAVKLIASGDFSNDKKRSQTNRIIIEGAGPEIDYLSVHQYVPTMSTLNTFRYQTANLHRTAGQSIYYDVMGSVAHMEQFLDQVVADARAASPAGKTIPVTFDEWNLWFNFAADIYQANYNLRDGIWTARMLSALNRRAPDVPIANIAQLVNCLGIVTSDKRGTFLTPSALAFKLFTDNTGAELLNSEVKCPPIPHETRLPALDCCATRGPNGLAVFLTNLHATSAARVKLSLPGTASPRRIVTLHHPNRAQYNTYAEPEAVRLVTELLDGKGEVAAFNLELPPHSVVCLAI